MTDKEGKEGASFVQTSPRPLVENLGNVTALRGIAALLVVFFHLNARLGHWIAQKLGPAIFDFYLLVDLFFVLSGFVMCHVYTTTFETRITWPSIQAFMYARFARIYPAHLACLLALLVLVGATKLGGYWPLMHASANEIYSAWSFAMNVLMLQAMHTTTFVSWNGPSWSLSAEWWTYLLFPFLLRPLGWGRGRGRIVVLVLAAIGVIVGFYVLEHVVATQPREDLHLTYELGFPRCVLGFFGGMVTYQVYRLGFFRRIFGSGLSGLVISALWLFACHSRVDAWLLVLFFPPIVLVSAYGSRRMNAFLGMAPLQRLGDWSLGIYLWHGVVIELLHVWVVIHPRADGGALPFPPTDAGKTLGCIAVCAITIVLGWVSFRFLETPARRMARRWQLARAARSPG